MIDVLSAFGLSSAAGLNACLPLLIVGLVARYTDLITLRAPWDALENPWVLGAPGVAAGAAHRRRCGPGPRAGQCRYARLASGGGTVSA
ncbi:MAG: DUF4126 domain-containing protein, partial [Chloroflexi bacterium]